MNSRQAPNFTTGLKRPAWVSSNVRQLATVVGDGSPSMDGKKAADAEQAIRALVQELAAPSNKDAFDVAICRFDGDRADRLIPIRRASEAMAEMKSLKLCSGRSGTNVTCGLEEAESILNERQGTEVREVDPCVLVFSDGQHNTGPRPEPVADRLKSNNVTIVTIAYGNDADEDLLRRLASSPQHSFRCKDGKALRAFLATVGATLSASIPRGIDPKQALSEIKQ
ncbi:MAG: VWA domain-containing protein [Deltaproteobacteria bacterium]|nr:VWA domain-containing protein [Deltaproteobacteria bacterium]